MDRFKGKIVMVTGGSRGIGRATAERFASEGAKVCILSNERQELSETGEVFRQAGYPVLTCLADITVPEEIENAVQRVLSEWGRIDVLINNAGIAWEEAFLDMTLANWCKILDVNLNGMFSMAQSVARQMVKQGGGIILNMSSTNGLAGEVKYAHYNASKGGIVLLTKTMALELGAHHIRVNAVCPGYIQTPMSEEIDDPDFVEEYVRTKIPLGRVGKPSDVAGVFTFLASDDAAFITGETIVVDGGQLAS